MSNVTTVVQISNPHFIGANTCGGSNPSPPNHTRNQSKNTQGYKKTTNLQSLDFQYLRDALTVCFVCDLPPEQAIQEFKDEYGRSPEIGCYLGGFAK